MAKTVHTISLAGGKQDTRESNSRRYTHAITALVTETFRAAWIKRCEDGLVVAKALVATHAALRTEADKVAYAEAKARREYLKASVTEQSGRTIERWLSDEYNGDTQKAFNSKGYLETRANSDAFYRTNESKYLSAVQALASYEERLPGLLARYQVGAEFVTGWSQSARNAETARAKVQGDYPGCVVRARTDFETRERAVRAKKGV